MTDEQKEMLTVKADVLLTQWKSAWDNYASENKLKVIGTEVEFDLPLINPETEAPSRTFREAGKIDAILEDANGGIWLGEHKTSSEDVSPASDYWDRLRIDTQISKYLLALIQMYPDREIMGVVYDVVKKPLQRLGSVPLTDNDGIKIVHDENGQRVFNKTGKPRQSGDTKLGYTLQSRPETIDEFKTRLESIVTNPADWVSIQQVGRLNSDLLEYMRDAWAASKQILYWKKATTWPRNPEACTAYGRCEFWDLCSGRATVDGIRYAPAQLNAELDGPEGDKEKLTNSRMRTLRKCARLHYHRYEEPIEKVGQEHEALCFGSLWHDRVEEHLKNSSEGTMQYRNNSEQAKSCASREDDGKCVPIT